MVEMVDDRRSAETKQERYDMFSNLLDAAHDNPDGSVAITEQELIGNCQFSYRIALVKTVLTRYPRKYVHPTACWT
jgi:hypothetical protein